MKYVPFAVNVYYAPIEMLFLACTEHISNTSLLKLRVMTISIMLKVLIKFRASEIMCTHL